MSESRILEHLLDDPDIRAAVIAELALRGAHIHLHECPTCARLAHTRQRQHIPQDALPLLFDAVATSV